MSQSALEYLIGETLHAEEVYFDDDGNLTDTPKIRYVTMYHSHVDLTKFVNRAREIEECKEHEVKSMFDIIKNNSVNNIATITNVDLFIKSWKRTLKLKQIINGKHI